MRAIATLRNAVRTRTFNDESREILTGNIYDDSQKRFDDGERIHTSYIVEEVEPNVFVTRSGNRYRVESWLPEETDN